MTERKVNIGGWVTSASMAVVAVMQYMEAQAKAQESDGLVQLVGVLVKSCMGGS